MEEKGNPEEAGKLFLQGWSEATNDFEKFLTAQYVARHQKTVPGKLKWLETALEHALKINDDIVKSAFPSLYLKKVLPGGEKKRLSILKNHSNESKKKSTERVLRKLSRQRKSFMLPDAPAPLDAGTANAKLPSFLCSLMR